ncbi:MAG: ATP-binding protein [Proteobacteria bacterium]|nr:ATP-binding protein [Pseudomonadota bacterium]
MSYIPRKISEIVLESSRTFPIVTLTGPRQSGKTTLAKMLFPSHEYVSLENPDQLLRAQEDPKSFLRHGKKPMILDEIQVFPLLMSYLQGMVDDRKQAGQFILTGSAQFQLLEGLSQSLAGRTAQFSLLPLSIEEILASGRQLRPSEWQSILCKGFYPRLYEMEQDALIFYRSYLQTFVERDVRQIAQINSLPDFQRFLRLLAGRTGQLSNFASLAGEIGVSQPTIKSWVHILEASYVVFRLSPYYENFGKRIVKSSKIYFFDTGLLSYLLGIETPEQLDRDPLRGSLFENFVVAELLKYRWNRGKEHQLFFFRDNHGLEVDLIFQQGHHLKPIEIKLSASYSPDFGRKLRKFSDLLGERALPSEIIYTGEGTELINGIQLSPWPGMNLSS